jgi:hypothetical protein
MRNIMLISVFVVLLCSQADAQLKEKDNLLGVSLGFWGKGEVPVFGVNYENEITQAGIGALGIGGLFRYYTLTTNYSNGDYWKYSFSSLGFQTNYNFNQIGDGKFVPFGGLVIGYNNVSSTYTDVTKHGVYISDAVYTSSAWLWLQLGMRYFFSDRVAGSLRLGVGNNEFNTLELGVDFKL